MLKSSLSAEQKREIYMRAYNENREEIDQMIADGIEKHRKGYCRLRITDKNSNPIPNKTIKLNQKSHDFKYGANILMLDEFKSERDNAEYRRMFKEFFNLATVPFYWNSLEPEEGKPRFDKNSKKIYRRPAPDLCVDYCQENGILPKLHCLVYDKFTPDWMHNLPLHEVKSKYEEHFRQIAERYSGRMYEFEVINEQLQVYYWDKQKRTPLVDQKDVIEWSFETARKYFPNEILVINEANRIPALAEKGYFEPYYMMIEKALLKGAPIDKIGVQNHMFTGAAAKDEEQYDASIINMCNRPAMCNPKQIHKGLDVLAQFGLPLEITEVTIPTFGDTDEDEQLQADMLKLWYSSWFSHPSVETIVYWNTIDGYAYDVDGWNENNCRGGLFRHDLTPKKAALKLKELFSEIWHTEIELTTDQDGYVDFRGFFGDYEATVDSKVVKFGVHKHSDNTYTLKL